MHISKVVAFACIGVITPVVLSVDTFAAGGARVVYAFAGAPDCGNLEAAPLIEDQSGNLYGTTTIGGAYQSGCVFELRRNGSTWEEVVLHSFSGADGNAPSAAVVFDRLGNLYGTTMRGGVFDGGVAFKLTPTSSGSWDETVLHSFGSGDDGNDARSNLIFDSQGNLYGTTAFSGGSRTGGTVFRISNAENGWTETVLYSFPGSIAGPDGDSPVGGVLLDRLGNIYGTTAAGGKGGYGAVYELEPSGIGSYRERVIYSFDGADGNAPSSGLSTDGKGNLYGTTAFGGNTTICYLVGCGIVFQLRKDSSGNFHEKILYSLSGNEGFSPVGPVVFDNNANAYVAAQSGGTYGMGSIFKLSPTATGSWIEKVVHQFDFKAPNGMDGQHPYAGVIAAGGHLWGTTLSGGVHDNGIVFELTP